MSPWWCLCTWYLSHASWSYRRRLGRVSVVVYLFKVCSPVLERNYFPLFAGFTIIMLSIREN